MKIEGQIRASKAISLHFLSAFGLVFACFLARELHGWSLVTHPSQTLRLLVSVEGPIVIGSYALVRRNPQHCSYWKAVGRGILGLPVGALINAFGAIVLGAPVGKKYGMETIYWSLLTSLFTLVPPACVFGSFKMDWQRILSHSKPTESVDCMISLPAHGAVIGAWLGAFPMPLDWERPWQEWPICVTYGAVTGYMVGLLVSSVCILLGNRLVHVKGD